MRITGRIIATLSLGLLCLAAAAPAAWNSQEGETLLGQNPDQVIAKHGVPDQVSVGPALLVFDYEMADGEYESFAFHQDVAVAVPAAGFKPKAATAPPEDRPYLGQSVRDAVLRAGSPTDWNMGTTAVRLVYADGFELSVMSGRVYAVSE